MSGFVSEARRSGNPFLFRLAAIAALNNITVAAVAALSGEIAEAAVDLIEVEYEELPHVIDPVAAMQPDAVLLHDDLFTQTATGKALTPSNVAEHLEMGRGDVGRGFAEADIVIERTFRTQT